MYDIIQISIEVKVAAKLNASDTLMWWHKLFHLKIQYSHKKHLHIPANTG